MIKKQTNISVCALTENTFISCIPKSSKRTCLNVLALKMQIQRWIAEQPTKSPGSLLVIPFHVTLKAFSKRVALSYSFFVIIFYAHGANSRVFNHDSANWLRQPVARIGIVLESWAHSGAAMWWTVWRPQTLCSQYLESRFIIFFLHFLLSVNVSWWGWWTIEVQHSTCFYFRNIFECCQPNQTKPKP